MEKFFIKTFGCQMNEADSERMASILHQSGLQEASEPSDADVILINGCSVREKPVHKALSELGRYKPLKKQDKQVVIGVGGRVGQLEKDKLFSGAPQLDFVFGPDTIDEIPELIYRVKKGERKVIFADFDKTQKYSTETKVFKSKAQAFVNIMKGCDKYCTYCIVPFTRGKEKSRTIQEVLDDLANLVSKGVREVTLLGQNVNSFGKGNANTALRLPLELSNKIGKVGPREGDENFPQLLYAIEKDPRLASLNRIRFTSSHPLDFSDELIECYDPNKGVTKLARQLHLPVQSGSNRVLAKMGRHHKIENYIEQMRRLRELDPTVGFSTDIIVGFPGETEEDFQETVMLLDLIEYDQIFAFAYSPRPGTRAEKLEDDVSDLEKNRRLNFLLDHQLEISLKNHQKRVGQTYEILVEGKAKNQKMEKQSQAQEVWMGRTSCGRLVHFLWEGPRDLTGHFLSVKILSATSLALYGECLDSKFHSPSLSESKSVETTLS